MISHHVKAMMDEVLFPYLGETMTIRLAAQTADTLNEFILALREFANQFGVDGVNPVIAEDVEDELLSEFNFFDDPEFAAFQENEAPPVINDDNVVAIGSGLTIREMPADKSEYEAFLEKRRREQQS
jgi:hypothetical protein